MDACSLCQHACADGILSKALHCLHGIHDRDQALPSTWEPTHARHYSRLTVISYFVATLHASLVPALQTEQLRILCSPSRLAPLQIYTAMYCAVMPPQQCMRLLQIVWQSAHRLANDTKVPKKRSAVSKLYSRRSGVQPSDTASAA